MKCVYRFNTFLQVVTGKLIQNSLGVLTAGGALSGLTTITMAGDLTDYEAVNDGNPEIRLGAADAEEVHIQAVYDGGAQTLDYALFQTDAASATANKGLFRFNVDGTAILDIDDGGINLVTAMALSINGTDVLDATTLGGAVVASSLTSVGTIATGVWQGTTVAADQGGTGHAVYAAGDVVYADTTTSLARLAKGSDTEVLTLASGVPTCFNKLRLET